MTMGIMSFLRKLFTCESGQTGLMSAAGIFATVMTSGLAIEYGHGYYAYRILQASTDAAALAAAAGMPDTTAASSYAAQYSSASGGLNQNRLLGSVIERMTPKCFSIAIACYSASGTSNYNGVVVTQTATVPLFFGALFNTASYTIKATSSAAAGGGVSKPYNIAVIMDITGSMGDSDNTSNCSSSTKTKLSCAMAGVQELLSVLTPCATGSDCTKSTSYVDNVALYAFPGYDVTSVSKTSAFEYPSSGCKQMTGVAYTFTSTATAPGIDTFMPESYNSAAANYNASYNYTYRLTPFLHDYRATAASTSLNSSSPLVNAVDCMANNPSRYGITSKTSASTYNTQVLYQAEEDLEVEQANNPGTLNAIIMLTDGGANNATLATLDGSTLNGTTTGKGWNQTYNNTSTAYPSNLGTCGQGILAAKAASDAGTAVYLIAYGAATTGDSGTDDCPTDVTYSTSITKNSISWGPGGSPCNAMKMMASSSANFYSDESKGCIPSVSSNSSLTNFNSIFYNIYYQGLTTPTLIPNSTTTQ